MNYMAFILSIGLLFVCGCVADGSENMFNRDSTSKWYKDADAFENHGFGFSL